MGGQGLGALEPGRISANVLSSVSAVNGLARNFVTPLTDAVVSMPLVAITVVWGLSLRITCAVCLPCMPRIIMSTRLTAMDSMERASTATASAPFALVQTAR